MGLFNFNTIPVSTLVGADWKTFKRITEGQHIVSERKTNYLLTKAICRLLSPFAALQERKYQKIP